MEFAYTYWNNNFIPDNVLMSMLWGLPLLFLALTARKFIGKLKGLSFALVLSVALLLIEQNSINNRFTKIDPDTLVLTYKEGRKTNINPRSLNKFWSITSIKGGHRCYLLIKMKNNISYRSMSILNKNNICKTYATTLNKLYYL